MAGSRPPACQASSGSVVRASSSSTGAARRRPAKLSRTGGYKVSALEIEETLREHPAIAECAVVGVPDPEWGERVCAAVVPERAKDGAGTLSLEELRDWARERLAPHNGPSRL